MKYLKILTKNLQESAGPISFMLMPSELLKKAHATIYTKIWAAIDAVYLMDNNKSIYTQWNHLWFIFNTKQLYQTLTNRYVGTYLVKKEICHEQIDSEARSPIVWLRELNSKYKK